ncbi:MAG TPA: tyrosinase family protein [Solirubrobacteraceae bacterium]|nr:tyrosinase family protein [Solirubrobacteraceae bacterium]
MFRDNRLNISGGPMEGVAMANGIVVRPDAQAANVAALGDAYRTMQAFSASDNRGWIYWAEFHGFNRYECWHHARAGSQGFPYDLFLPWHRAYLTFFDNAARDRNPEAILPWWDWTSEASHQSGLPSAYTSGGPALQSGPVPAIDGQPERRTSRNPSGPGRLPTARQVEELLGLSDFRDFSNQLQDIHDGIHGWVGGDMGSIATSAFDPVFWAHHAMIDRIWYLWQIRHGVNNIPAEYLDKALFPGYTVQQVLDVRALGYDYATAAVGAGTNVPPGLGGAGAGEAPQATPNPTQTTPPTAGPTYTSETLYVAALDPTASRIDIEFHNVVHAGASYEGRVYLNNPEAGEDTGYDDPSYAGSYYIFGHGGCLGDPGHCDVEPRREYDPRPAHPLTPALKVVIANDQARETIQQADELTVTVVPIIEPLPYDVDPKYTEDPLEVGYVAIVGYR